MIALLSKVAPMVPLEITVALEDLDVVLFPIPDLSNKPVTAAAVPAMQFEESVASNHSEHPVMIVKGFEGGVISTKGVFATCPEAGLNHPVTVNPLPFPGPGVVNAFGFDKYPEFKDKSELPMTIEEGSKVVPAP